MSSRSSQPLIWTFVALLTAALFASALKWGRITIDLPDPPIQQSQLIELSFIEIQKPESKSTPRPAPPVIPPTESPVPEPIPELEAFAEPEPEPTPPKLDPALVKKQRQAKAAQERELARKRIDEKRRQKLIAQKAETARRKAAAANAAARQRAVSKPSGISQPKPKYPPCRASGRPTRNRHPFLHHRLLRDSYFCPNCKIQWLHAPRQRRPFYNPKLAIQTRPERSR